MLLLYFFHVFVAAFVGCIVGGVISAKLTCELAEENKYNFRDSSSYWEEVDCIEREQSKCNIITIRKWVAAE